MLFGSLQLGTVIITNFFIVWVMFIVHDNFVFIVGVIVVIIHYIIIVMGIGCGR